MSIYTKIIFLLIFFYSIGFSSSHKIQEIYYINVDSEKKRNRDFLENYNKHSLEIPLHRISGIVPKSGNGSLRKGEFGCALSHMKVLDEISKKNRGWYLVCEDDCCGDFRLIEKKVKTIIRLHPFIMHINLYSPNKHFSISPCTGSRTTAYLITPLGAKLGKKIIKRNLKKHPCDMALCYSIIHAVIAVRFNKILSPDGSPSTIDKINKN